MEKLHDDIRPDILNGISDLDLGVWATPEGTTFVDGQCRLLMKRLILT
jgi:hypothetical protein